jgi:hypothetical protein
VIEIESYHPTSASVQRNLGVFARVAAKIDDSAGFALPDRIAHECVLQPARFRLIAVVLLVIPPNRCCIGQVPVRCAASLPTGFFHQLRKHDCLDLGTTQDSPSIGFAVRCVGFTCEQTFHETFCFGHDPQGNGVPIPSREGAKTLSHARGARIPAHLRETRMRASTVVIRPKRWRRCDT